MSKRFWIFYTKNLFFLFYIITFTKHLHQFIYYTQFFIKIIFFLTFSIISHLPPPNPQSLCLSLSPNPQSLCLSSLKVSASLFFLIVWKLQGREKMMMMMMMMKMKMIETQGNRLSLFLILRSLKSLPPLGLYLILILGLGYGFSVNGLILS